MNFRNLTFFRFNAPAFGAYLAQQIGLGITEQAFREPGPLEMKTQGFVSPLDFTTTSDLVPIISGMLVLAVACESKFLPASIVQRHVSQRANEIAEKENRRVGARERKRIKEEVLSELLPRALTRRTVTRGYIDPANGWLVIGAASRRCAEEFVTLIREALGRFPATPLAPQESPRALMTGWVINNRFPDGFAGGDECLMISPADSGTRWAGKGIDLGTDEVLEHLRGGLQVFRLGIEIEGRCSFVLDEDLTIRKFALSDVVLDEQPDDASESAAAQAISDITLLSLEINRVVKHLDRVFGLPMPEVRA